MSVIDKQPTNLNYLTPTGFRFLIQRLPKVEYFCTAVDLPGISVNPVEQSSPLATIYYPGDRLNFSEFSLKFKVDEDMTNYQEVFNWLVGMGHPETLEQYRDLVKDANLPSRDNLFSDTTLVIETQQNNPNIQFFFKECFPTSLSPVSFNTTDSTVSYLEADISFRFLFYNIERV